MGKWKNGKYYGKAQAMMRILSFVILSLISWAATAQNAPGFYWVQFSDKNGTPYSLDYPQAFLSERALQKRQLIHKEITEQDLPVNPTYVQAVLDSSGGSLHHTSKWFNSMTVNLTSLDSATLELSLAKINNLPFVVEVKNTAASNKVLAGEKKMNTDTETAVDWSEPSSTPYGKAFNQLDLLSIPRLHEAGFKGKGVHVGVFDVGWMFMPAMHAFDALREEGRLVMVRDFVNPLQPDVFDGGDHGTTVLALMTAELDSGRYLGAAPEANYYLFQTENVSSEYRIEEDNWVAAAELADSLGLDVINSSLGYSTFDDSTMNYTYADMNGHVSRASQAAQWLSERGVLVVCSAGNSGTYPWYYIHAPSDAEKILCIGATDSLGVDATFSSHGPSSDGRMKPSITCQGRRTYYPIQQDAIGRGSGTSFSAPLITGGMACAMQAIPNVDNQLWMEWVQAASTQADNPDYHMGHGIPDLWWMLQKNTPGLDKLPNFQIQTIYPNPTSSQLNVITTGAPVLGWQVSDITGRLLVSCYFDQSWTRNYLQLDVSDLPQGSYHFTLMTTEGKSTSIFLKDLE